MHHIKYAKLKGSLHPLPMKYWFDCNNTKLVLVREKISTGTNIVIFKKIFSDFWAISCIFNYQTLNTNRKKKTLNNGSHSKK